MIKNTFSLFCLMFCLQTVSYAQSAEMTSAVELTDLLFAAEVTEFQSNEVTVSFVCERSYQPKADMPGNLIIHQGMPDKKGKMSTLHEEIPVTISEVVVAESGIAVTLTLKLAKKNSVLNNYLKTEDQVFVRWQKDLLLEHEIVKQEDGTAIIDVKYFDGFAMGKSIEYSEDDSIKRVFYNMLGQYHGEYEIYYNDTLFKRLNYFLGELSGPEIWYHSNGKIRYEGENINGLKEGPAKNFYEDGTLHTVGFFEKDSLEGEYVSYHPNGNKKVHGYKHRGQYTGTCTSYYENGNIHFQQEKINGVNTGKYFRNYQSGKREVDANWLNDLLEGERIDYYENGEKKMQGSYKAGKQIGEWTYWDESGVERKENFE